MVNAGLPGNPRGKDMMLRLACWDEDPDPDCLAAPIVAWASLCWDGKVDEDTMALAWRRQQSKFGLAAKWSQVEGPAGASLMSAKAIGWTWPAWHTFLNKEKQRMDGARPV